MSRYNVGDIMILSFQQEYEGIDIVGEKEFEIIGIGDKIEIGDYYWSIFGGQYAQTYQDVDYGIFDPNHWEGTYKLKEIIK